MTIKGFRRVGEPPDAHRVTVLLGNRDQDLKEWCWHNPDRVGELFRQVMRRELIEMGELTVDGQVNELAAPPLPRTPPRAVTPPAPRTPSAPVAPVVPAARVEVAAPAPQTTPVEAPAAGPAVEGTPRPGPVVVNDEAKGRIGRLIAGNRDFA